MRWTARYRDGFCSRLLVYRLIVDSGNAILHASWHRPEPPCREYWTTFSIDERPLQTLLPLLRQLNLDREDEWVVEDCSSAELIIEDSPDHPQAERFEGEVVQAFPPYVEFFKWLEEQVIAQLPWSSEAITDPFD